jgi:hypothetical protein
MCAAVSALLRPLNDKETDALNPLLARRTMARPVAVDAVPGTTWAPVNFVM